MKRLKMMVCFAVAAVLACACMGLAGCGIGGTTADNEITVAVINNSSEVTTANQFKAAYQKKYPNRKVSIVRITGGLDNWIVKQKQARSLPDIIQVYDYSAAYWTAQNLYYPISDLMAKDGLKESDYFEAIIDIAKSGDDGKVYWAPRDYNKTVIAYNKDIFDAAQVSYPTDTWTWTDFLNTCNALKEKANAIKSAMAQTVFYPISANLNWEAVYYPAIKSYGGDIIDKDAGKAMKNKDAFIKGVSALLALADEGLALPPTQDTVPFANKQCAMQICVRPDIVSYANNLRKSDGSVPMDFVAMPSYDDPDVETSYIGLGCTGYGITTGCTSAKREMAWDFLKLVMTEEGQESFCATGSGFPVLVAMAEDENATYRSYLPGANHDAFYKFPERDLPMNYLAGFKPSAHLYIRQVLTDTMLKQAYSASDRTAFFNELESRLNNAIGR